MYHVCYRTKDFSFAGYTSKKFSTYEEFLKVKYIQVPGLRSEAQEVRIQKSGKYEIWKDGKYLHQGEVANCQCKDVSGVKERAVGEGGSQSGTVVNYATSILSADELQKAIAALTTSNNNGLNATIYVTDENTASSLIENVQTALANTKDSDAILWVNINLDKTVTLKDFSIGGSALTDKSGKNISSSVKGLFSIFKEVYVRPLTFNPLTAMLDGLGSLIRELTIPERFWNPELKEYDDVFLIIFKYTRAATSLGTSLVTSEIKTGAFTVSQLEFAATCGFYNSLIATVAGLPEGASFILKLITNEDDTWTNFKAMFGQIQSYCGKNNIEVYIAIPEMQIAGYAKCAWPLIVNHFTEGNACQISYNVGGAVFQIVTVVIAFTKAGALTRVAEVLDLLDPLSLTIRAALKLAKPLIKGGRVLYKFGREYITAVLENGKYVLKLAKETGDIISDIDWEKTLRWAELVDEFGNTHRVGLYLDETEFAAALKRMDDAKAKLKLAKDGKDIPITVDGNYGLAELPAADANGEALVGVVDNLAKGVGKTQLLAKLDNLNVPNVKNWINRLDDATDAALLRKIDDLATSDPAKLSQLDELYKNMSAPAGKKGMGDFTIQVDGKNVYYDKNGFPDFEPHSPGKNYSVESNNLAGRNPNPGPQNVHPDFDLANKELVKRYGAENIDVRHASGSPVLIKINGKWEGPFTWHHHQDGKTLMPVLQSIHKSSSHSGGADVITKGLQGLFNSPY